MAKKKTIATADMTRRSSRMAKVFQMQKIQVVNCSASQDLRKGPLPTNMNMSLQVNARISEQKQLVVNIDCNFTSRYDKSQPTTDAICLQALFRLIYTSEKSRQVTERDLAAFSHVAAAYAVWPYWREFVQSMTTRMGLPSITLPPYSLDDIASIEPGAKKAKNGRKTPRTSKPVVPRKKKRVSKK